MMDKSGLTKLMEECGELIQIAAKKSSYFDTDDHPDGGGGMEDRLSDEIADVLAACAFVQWSLCLSVERIKARSQCKLKTFKQWTYE